MRNTLSNASRRLLPILLLITLLVTAATANDREPEREELLARALAVSPDHTVPVMRNRTEPVMLFHDLDGDGRSDVTILSIVADPRIAATVEHLSDPLRLYADRPPEPFYVLETYLGGPETFTSVELGRHAVWSGMVLVRLTERPLPVAVEITFRSRAGNSTEIVLFHEDGLTSRFSYEENRNERGWFGDMNGNGSLEIVTTRRVPEAGHGYETFLELHELGEYGYRRTRSLALVRLVNEFLDEAARELETGAWESALARIRSTMDPSPAPDDSPGVRPLDDLASAFRGLDEEDEEHSSFDYPSSETAMEEVTFPRLADNPFPAPYLGRSFRLVFRVECCDEIPRFYQAIVALADDPFENPPFAFLTDHGTGQ